MKFLYGLMLGCVCVLPLSASAQWQWIDQNGKKVYSDQAPPPEVPEKNILRRAGSQPSARATGNAAAGDADATPSKARDGTAKPSGVDKDLQEKAKKAEADEKAKQAAEDAKFAKAKADNCAIARQGKATVDSGMRVATLNAQGEREIMDDAARAAEQRRLQTIIDSDCK